MKISNYLGALAGILGLLFGYAVNAQSFDVNEIGTGLYEVSNRSVQGAVLAVESDNLSFAESGGVWRKTNLDDGSFYLDFDVSEGDLRRLLATRFLGGRLAKSGLEGRGPDTCWNLVAAEGGWNYLQHKTTGRYLSLQEDKFVLVKDAGLDERAMWKLDLKRVDLDALESPILMMGNDTTGFRDPAVIYHEGVFYMYYSLVLTEEDEKIYWYIAYSKSEDLVTWTDPVIITEKDQQKNFGSPGNVIRYNGEWILCMQTYVIPNYKRGDRLRFGNKDCRIWITRSKDLENWSEPEMLWVKGEGKNPGKMIDAYLVEDKDEKGKWWAFYKQAGANYSYSYDLKNWTYHGKVLAGENVCVWVENDEYYMLHSPEKGMGLLKSSDLTNWEPVFEENILGQDDWGHWAGQRVTAGFIMDMRDDPRFGKYIMFFHGQGPAPKSTEIINSGTDLAIAWSDDLIHWEWPE
ncbi:MAG: hypothetical protein ACPGN3_12950 [Opitutales bacterium]